MALDVLMKTVNATLRMVIRVSGGRIGHRFMGMPSLELITTGRRSGKPRSVMLTTPMQVDGHSVIVASRGGDDRHPAWFLNLRDRPDVEVSVKGGPRTPMRARILDSAERAPVWAEIAGKYSNYAGYQKRTEREIPLVVLEPVGLVVEQ